MYNEKIEGLIKAALADGELTEKEKQILFRRAEEQGIDLDEFEMVLDARLYDRQQTSAIKNQEAAPKSDKFGSVRKCPVCGAIVSSGMAACVECGYAFSDISTNTNWEKLCGKLEEIDEKFDKKGGLLADSVYFYRMTMKQQKKAAAKMQLISTFPVPITRAELLSFLSSIQPLANKKGPKNGLSGVEEREDFGYAYYMLYGNCINKAKISFSNDKSFEPYFKLYEEMNQKPQGLFGKLFSKK